jgi:hypothetical protein
MFTNPISVMFLELPTKLYSSNNECNEMTDPTKHQWHHNQEKDRVTKFTFSVSYTLLKDGFNSTCSPTHYQSYSWKYLPNYIVPTMNAMK